MPSRGSDARRSRRACRRNRETAPAAAATAGAFHRSSLLRSSAIASIVTGSAARPRSRARSRRIGRSAARLDPAVDALLEDRQRQRAAAEHGIVERGEIESIAELALGLPPQPKNLEHADLV